MRVSNLPTVLPLNLSLSPLLCCAHYPPLAGERKQVTVLFADFKGSMDLLFFLGIVLFSGSLYALSVSEMRWLGAITPFGGLAFLAGWLCLAWAGWKR